MSRVFSPNSTHGKAKFPAFEAKPIRRTEDSRASEVVDAGSKDESLLSYNFQPNERRKRYFARCPDSALRKEPTSRVECSTKSEAARSQLSAETAGAVVAYAQPGEDPTCPIWEKGRQESAGFGGVGLHYPLSEKFMGINTPGRTEERHVFDVKANVQLWPDVKTSKPRDPHEGLLARLEDIYGSRDSPKKGAVDLCSASTRASEKAHCSDNLARKAVLERIEAVLDTRRKASLVACTAFSKLRVKLRDLFEMIKPASSSQYIYRDEFFEFLKHLDLHPLEAAKDICFRMVDKDKDGFVSFGDFEKLFQLHENNLREIPRARASTEGPLRYEDLEKDFREEFYSLLSLTMQLGERLRLFRLAVAEAFGSVRSMSKPEIKARIQSVFTASRIAQNEEVSFLVDQLYSV